MKPAAALSMALAIVASCTTPSGTPEGDAFAGDDACAACHEQEAQYCRYGAHRTVECERCHGPGTTHARADGSPRPRMLLGDVELCLSCHRQGSGPAVPKIESFEAHLTELERRHRVRLDRQRSGTDCVYCHDPHLLE